MHDLAPVHRSAGVQASRTQHASPTERNTLRNGTLGAQRDSLLRRRAPIAPSVLLFVQRTAGNSATATYLQRSALSAELQMVYLQEGRDALFDRLSGVRQSDRDVVDFVDTLPDPDRELARSLLGVTRMSPATRGVVVDAIVLGMAHAALDFDRAVGMVEEDIRAERQARADLANLLVGVAFSFAVPGVGSALARLVNRIPVNASDAVYRVAILTQDQAPNIASALGEVGKEGAKGIIDSTAGSSPRAFFNSMREGFQAGQTSILGHIRNTIDTMHDYQLLLYAANWDSQEITAERYAAMLRRKWNEYESQVLDIGDLEAHMISAIGEATRTTLKKLVRVRGRTRMAIVVEVHETGMGRARMSTRFVSWVSEELEPLALERASRVRQSVETLDPSDIQGLPR